MDALWRKWLLIACCGAGLAIVICAIGDEFGAGGRAWYGWWDANVALVAAPYTVDMIQVRPGGASWVAGLRDGDRLDMRDQSLDARVAVLTQLPATARTHLVVRRGGRTFVTDVVGSTVWEGVPLWKLPAMVLRDVAAVWFVACAFLIVVRRSEMREARILALVLLCQIGIVVGPGSMVIPGVGIELVTFVLSAALACAASVLLVYLSSRFGVRTAWRRVLELAAYASNVLVFVGAAIFPAGITGLRFDPLPYAANVIVHSGYSWWSMMGIAGTLLVCACSIAAVTGTPRAERARTAWLVLPLALVALGVGAVSSLLGLAQSWFVYIAFITLWGVSWLLGALAVTYALLKRRVLDFEFVLSRALVFATLSFVVVAAFVLLEWLLGTVLANVSHATGLAANAGLALVLGLSMSFLHQRVDGFIDGTFFRKRHDDERALRAFAKEAAYVTQSDALLDQAMAHIEKFTDASAAALMVDGNGSYVARRSFGAVAVEADENDPAVLALKARHEPIDPHRYESALQGALALPMLGRGRVIGIVVLGERVGNEAYSPDEIDALSEFAHGVGAALDALSTETAQDELRATIADLAAGVRALPERIVAEIRRSG